MCISCQFEITEYNSHACLPFRRLQALRLKRNEQQSHTAVSELTRRNSWVHAFLAGAAIMPSLLLLLLLPATPLTC